MKIRKVICKSGLVGEQRKLRIVYHSFEDFKNYSEIYGIHSRLGYKTAKAAWDKNPLIQSSVEPSDLIKVTPKQAENAIRLYKNKMAKQRRKYLGK